MSKNEVGNINESLKKKSTPTPKLLLKYHKKIDKSCGLTNSTSDPSNKFIRFFFKSGLPVFENHDEEE